jgi:hypothetical protein
MTSSGPLSVPAALVTVTLPERRRTWLRGSKVARSPVAVWSLVLSRTEPVAMRLVMLVTPPSPYLTTTLSAQTVRSARLTTTLPVKVAEELA